MVQRVTLEKTEKWAQEPIKEYTTDKGHCLYNVYTTTLQKGVPTEVSTGVIIPPVENRAVLILGNSHTNLNKNMKIKNKIIGGGELTLSCINYGESEIEINPLTKLTEFVVLKVSSGAPIVCDSLDETERGQRGFGSTGY